MPPLLKKDKTDVTRGNAVYHVMFIKQIAGVVEASKCVPVSHSTTEVLW